MALIYQWYHIYYIWLSLFTDKSCVLSPEYASLTVAIVLHQLKERGDCPWQCQNNTHTHVHVYLPGFSLHIISFNACVWECWLMTGIDTIYSTYIFMVLTSKCPYTRMNDTVLFDYTMAPLQGLGPFQQYLFVKFPLWGSLTEHWIEMYLCLSQVLWSELLTIHFHEILGHIAFNINTTGFLRSSFLQMNRRNGTCTPILQFKWDTTLILIGTLHLLLCHHGRWAFSSIFLGTCMQGLKALTLFFSKRPQVYVQFCLLW